MAEYDGITQYLKAAPRRLRDAEELLQQPTLAPSEQGSETRHLRGAIYLAGYAVECELKGYIIARSGCATLGQVLILRRSAGEAVPNLLGEAGHHLATLLSMTDLEAVLDRDDARKRDWGLCLRWKSTWRYDPTNPDEKFARDFVAASRRVYLWIDRQL